MHHTFKVLTIALLTAGVSQLGFADSTVSTAEFADTSISGYMYSGGKDPVTSVSAGVLHLTVDLGNANSNTGIRWTQTNHAASSNTDLSHYVVSFDLAIKSGSLSGVTAGLTIAGTGTDNVNTPIDLTQVPTDGSYAHYSINLGGLSTNEVFNGGNAKLNPTDSSYNLELAVFGNSSGSVTFLIKNFKVSTVSK